MHRGLDTMRGFHPIAVFVQPWHRKSRSSTRVLASGVLFIIKIRGVKFKTIYCETRDCRACYNITPIRPCSTYYNISIS